jgi:hypothetical protein
MLYTTEHDFAVMQLIATILNDFPKRFDGQTNIHHESIQNYFLAGWQLYLENGT